MRIPGWDWVIGTGIYVDDVDAVFKRKALQQAAIFGVVLMVVVGAASMVTRSIVRPLAELRGVMTRLSEGSIDMAVPPWAGRTKSAPWRRPSRSSRKG